MNYWKPPLDRSWLDTSTWDHVGRSWIWSRSWMNGSLSTSPSATQSKWLVPGPAVPRSQLLASGLINGTLVTPARPYRGSLALHSPCPHGHSFHGPFVPRRPRSPGPLTPSPGGPGGPSNPQGLLIPRPSRTPTRPSGHPLAPWARDKLSPALDPGEKPYLRDGGLRSIRHVALEGTEPNGTGSWFSTARPLLLSIGLSRWEVSAPAQRYVCGSGLPERGDTGLSSTRKSCRVPFSCSHLPDSTQPLQQP